MFYPKPSQRPEHFRLNSGTPLYQGLMLAGLGQHPGALLYHDDSPSRAHGVLTGYSGAGDTPAERWHWDGFLERWVLGFDGTDDYVLLPAIDVTGPITVAAWVNTSSANRFALLDHLHGSGGFEGYCFHLNFVSNPNKMSWYSGGGWKYSNTNVNDGSWHHVAFVGGTAYNFFLDGKADGTAASFSNATSWTGAALLNKTYSSVFAPATETDLLVWSRPLPLDYLTAVSDPGNTDLRLAGEPPLILPVRKLHPVALATQYFRPNFIHRTSAAQAKQVGVAEAGDSYNAGAETGGQYA